jgi:hypothetical protein
MNVICIGQIFMKIKAKKLGEPPSHLDVQAWTDIINSDGLANVCAEDIVAAIQGIGPDGDKRVRSALTGHISEAMLKIMSGKVRKSYNDGGREIIWRALDKLIFAVLTPGSADGMALCATFRATVELRLIDSVRDEIKYHSRFEPLAVQTNEITSNADYEMDFPDDKPTNYAEQMAQVESVLKKISDPRKQRAFRLHMEEIPILPGKGTISIAQELNISARTAGEWIKEIKALLEAHVQRKSRRDS